MTCIEGMKHFLAQQRGCSSLLYLPDPGFVIVVVVVVIRENASIGVVFDEHGDMLGLSLFQAFIDTEVRRI